MSIQEWESKSIDLFHITSILEELIPHLPTQELFLSLSHANLHFVRHSNQGPGFHTFEKRPTQTTLSKGNLKEIFFQFFGCFFCPLRILGVSVLPSLSSNTPSVSSLRIPPHHARGRADYIFHRLVVAAVVQRLGCARWVHLAAVSRWHRCAAVLEAELCSRGNSNSSRPIKSFSLPLRQARIILFYRKEHFVVFLAVLIKAEYMKHTKIWGIRLLRQQVLEGRHLGLQWMDSRARWNIGEVTNPLTNVTVWCDVSVQMALEVRVLGRKYNFLQQKYWSFRLVKLFMTFSWRCCSKNMKSIQNTLWFF